MMFSSRMRTVVVLMGAIWLTSAATAFGKQKPDPLYLHWFSLGNPHTPLVATLRVYPDREFSLELGEHKNISGRLTKDKKGMRVKATATHVTPASFDTPAPLDKRLEPRLQVIIGGLAPQYLVLSKRQRLEPTFLASLQHQPSPKRPVAEGVLPLPFKHLVFRRKDAGGKQIFHLQINKDGSYFCRSAGDALTRGRLTAVDVRKLRGLVDQLPSAGAALEIPAKPPTAFYEVVVERNGGVKLYSSTDLYNKSLAPIRLFLVRLMRQVVSAEAANQDAAKRVADLLEQLDSNSSTRRASAAKQLGELGAVARAAVPKLVKMAETPQAELVRKRVYQALGKIGPDAAPAIPVFVRLIKERTDGCYFVAKQLGQIGEPAAPYIIELLNSKDRKVQRDAVTAVESAGPSAAEATQQLIVLLNNSDEDESFRARLFSALRSIGPGAKAAIPHLLRHLETANPRERGPIAYALGALDRSGEVVPVLRRLLDEDYFTVAYAIKGLGAIGPNAKSAVPELIETLQNGDKQICYLSIVAMGEIGPNAKAAIPVLKTVIKRRFIERSSSESYYADVRGAAAKAINKISGSRP